MSFSFLAALSRRRLLAGTGALVLLPVGGARAANSMVVPAAASPAATGVEAASAFRMELVLEMRIEIAATLQMGDGAVGTGRLMPIIGGTFSGPRLSGVVVPGGTDWRLERSDGVTTVEANCTLKTTDGTLISVIQRGLIAPLAAGAAPEARVHTVPEFEVPVGPHDWLNKSVFVGSLDASQFRQGQVLARVFRAT